MAKSKTIRVMQATRKQALYVSQRLRAIDKKEIWELLKHSPSDALMNSFFCSLQVWAIMVDKRPVAIFGVAPAAMLGDVGVPWLLGTKHFNEASREVLKQGPMFVGRMLAEFPTLRNVVHAENLISIKWLKSLGFKIEPATPMGHAGAFYHKFSLTREGWNV